MSGSSQTHTDEVAVDLKPRTKRSGKPGDRVTYIAVLKNHLKETATWDVTCTLDPVAPGLSILASDHVDLPARGGKRWPLMVAVVEGAVPGQEVEIVLTLHRKPAAPVTVRRKFTVANGPGHHHPR